MLEPKVVSKEIDEVVAKIDPAEAAENLTPEHPRFREVYSRMKDFERELESVRAEKTHSAELIDAMKEHNTKLAEAIEQGVSKAVESVNSKNEISDMQAKIDSNIDKVSELKGKKKQAYKDADWDALESIDEEVERIKDETNMLRFSKQEKVKEKEKVIAPESAESKPIWNAVSKKAIDDFTKQCPWYNSDSVMRAAAIQLDYDYNNSEEWQGKPLALRLSKVKEVIENRFHVSPSGNGSPGSSGNYGGASSGGEEIKLTDQQRMVAAGLGISDKDYTEQLRMIGGKQ